MAQEDLKGCFRYFATDVESAFVLYNREPASWEAGLDPWDSRAVSGSPTIAEVCNTYLAAQDDKLQVGELSPRTFQEQHSTCKRMTEHFGRHRHVDSLKPADFAKLRMSLAQPYGPTRLANEIVRIRTVFKWAFENEVIEANVRYGTQFSKPKKEVIRRYENSRDIEVLIAPEIRSPLDAAAQPMKALSCWVSITDSDRPTSPHFERGRRSTDRLNSTRRRRIKTSPVSKTDPLNQERGHVWLVSQKSNPEA